MSTERAIGATQAAVQKLLDVNVVGQILRAEGGIRWPDGREPGNIRIERAWPTHGKSFVVEWSFDLGSGPRYALFGTPTADANSNQAGTTNHPTVAADGIRGVLVHLPRWGVRIHSPDQDPDLPQLARCLDERAMADRLEPFWNNGHQRHDNDGREIECRLLSYRSARRATLSLRRLNAIQPEGNLIGKTFRDGRGESLLVLHDQLDRQLASSTKGRVRVPSPVGYLTDLRMALFGWARGEEGGDGWGWLCDRAVLAADALAALHGESIEGLDDFSREDECAVILRWHEALGRVDDHLFETTQPLLDALLRGAESMGMEDACTVHRDFYERQLIYDGKTITILDLDTLAHGEPSIDVGNLLAHLFLGALRAGRPVRDYPPAARLVLDRYAAQRGPVDRPTLAFYLASALFRLGAVHVLRTTTSAHAPALWRLADELLVESGGEASGHTNAGGKSGKRDDVPMAKWILEGLAT
ncbi:MAG: phosphotransferase [Planctomycetes bacterium]|nr:phosphotransferase [Planctomycetota bacterium]